MLKYSLPKYKIASSSARDWKFIEELTSLVPKKTEIVVSVGGSTLIEIEELLKKLPRHTVVLQHCVAEYPCPLDRLRLGNLQVLKDTFEDDRIKIGYSGHEMGTSVAEAIYKKYQPYLIEKHFCLSRHSFVHHIECSLEPDEFATMIENSKTPNMFSELPYASYETSFGMSDVEEEFLKKQTYGNTYLGSASDWTK
jgi:sialic acid synthase SpsE